MDRLEVSDYDNSRSATVIISKLILRQEYKLPDSLYALLDNPGICSTLFTKLFGLNGRGHNSYMILNTIFQGFFQDFGQVEVE